MSEIDEKSTNLLVKQLLKTGFDIDIEIYTDDDIIRLQNLLRTYKTTKREDL